MNQVKAVQLPFASLVAQLDVVELEERLEMVSLASLVAGSGERNGCCCLNPS